MDPLSAEFRRVLEAGFPDEMASIPCLQDVFTLALLNRLIVWHKGR